MIRDEEAAIARRQRIAEMLMQQGQQPLETNQVAGGYVVPVSPLAGVAKVAQQLAGAYVGKKADEQRTDLNQKKADMIKAMVGSDTPDYGAVAEAVSPEAAVNLYSTAQAHKQSHADKLEERKIVAEQTAAQRKADQEFRAQQAEMDRQQRFQQQRDMAQLTASLSASNRPSPQPQTPVQVIDPVTGQPVFVAPGQSYGMRPFTAQTLKQEQAEAAKAQQKDQASLSAQQALDQAAILNAHPGRQMGTGASSFLSKIPGMPARDFQANLDTFKAQTFVPMVSAMKGMGALSDAEGKKLSESVGALDPSMSEAAFQESLKGVTKYLYDKAQAAGLNVSIPEFAAGDSAINIDIKDPANDTPEARAAIAADIAKEQKKKKFATGGWSIEEVK